MFADTLSQRASLSERTLEAARDVLVGRRRRWHSHLAFAGPAVVAEIGGTILVPTLNVSRVLQTFGIPVPV